MGDSPFKIPIAYSSLYLTSSFLANVSRSFMGVASQEPPVPPLLSSSARGLSIARLLWSFLCPRAALEGGGGRDSVRGAFIQEKAARESMNGMAGAGRRNNKRPSSLITGFPVNTLVKRLVFS